MPVKEASGMMSADTSRIKKVSQLAPLNPSAGSLYFIFYLQETVELVESNLEAYSTPRHYGAVSPSFSV